MDNYRTIQGDAWDSIAARLYGNEYLSYLLVDANPKHRLTV
ncbi:phage tail protein, partial [Salmonella enterica]|nr:phage tail protein [Salmonella enterica]ECS6295642.1 phage tail protein [Salmonella enterica subsp. enterica serovar Birkenhead]EBJ4221240.1 phage tail protein [Salmonella enterica]ECS6295644.1 phage tail protein [Salmonella enterica subsp. enterica serovar Birkenhead]ECX5746923.1 phage tail protein [Salmonella enterica]